MKAKNPIVWFEIYVDNMDRARKFYENVFAVKLNDLTMPDTLDDEMKMMAFPSDMEGFGASGVLVKTQEIKAGGNSTLVYFGSEDCSVEEQRIEKAGGKILEGKQSLGEYGFMVLLADTEGNTIGIHSMK